MGETSPHFQRHLQRSGLCLVATGVELGEAHREATDLVEVRLVPVEEALRMARAGGTRTDHAPKCCRGVNHCYAPDAY